MQRPSNPTTAPSSDQSSLVRLFALSDVHADIKANREWLSALSARHYSHDTLILAGDISDSLTVLKETLSHLNTIFDQVCFVPGNHELWVRKREYSSSIEKFHHVRRLCNTLGVHMQPVKIGATHQRAGVWVVPLLSWYVQPEEGPGSLFRAKPGEDPTLAMWSDNHFTRWPENTKRAADFFLDLNEMHITRTYDAPIISFSHFLPRAELIFSTQAERQAAGMTTMVDPHPRFNFSRVAGSTRIDEQIRRLGATTHVYGHQHRNRNRVIDGVRYISHCLGYPRERKSSDPRVMIQGPQLIWHNQQP